MTVAATAAPSEVLAPRTVSVARGQSTLPADTLFGREMHATGWAGALVVLSFAGSWIFPLLTSVIAGDVFSSEDRLGTWRHLLVAVRSPRRIFIAKSLASLTVLLMCVPGLAVSGIIGGLVVGNQPLTGLDGHLLSPADAAGMLLLAWLCALAPVLAFAAIGLLAAVIFGRSPIGLLLPAFGGQGMQLASQVLPMPTGVRVALPSFAFLSWNGLFTSPPQLSSLIAGIAVSLAWAATAGSGIDAGKLQQSLATSFGHLYVVQSREVNHLSVTAAQLRTTASCTKGVRPGRPGRARKRLALLRLLASPWRQRCGRTGRLPA